MTKIQLDIDPEELREPTLPKGDYLATVTNCYVDRGSWKDLTDIQRCFAKYTLAEHPDVPIALGHELSSIMPIAKGISNDYLAFCAVWGVHPSEFDPDDIIGQSVLLSVTAFEDKKTKAMRNMIVKVARAPEGI